MTVRITALSTTLGIFSRPHGCDCAFVSLLTGSCASVCFHRALSDTASPDSPLLVLFRPTDIVWIDTYWFSGRSSCLQLQCRCILSGGFSGRVASDSSSEATGQFSIRNDKRGGPEADHPAPGSKDYHHTNGNIKGGALQEHFHRSSRGSARPYLSGPSA